jgi:hypothetical protein
MQVNASTKFYAWISSSWTELNDAGGARAISGFWGMSSNSPLDRTARPGYCTLWLNNSGGLYTPGGPSALAGFKKGIPVKTQITFEGSEYVYRWYIDDIDPKPLIKDKLVRVDLVDWLDYADRHPIVNPGIQTSQRGDEMLTTLNGLIEITPQATDFDTGVETFPTTFDTVTSSTHATDEFEKVALSELGYVYLDKDSTYGETLRFEAANARYGWRDVGEIPKATSDSGFLKKEDDFYLLLETGDKIILNEVQTTPTLDGSFVGDFDAPYGDNQINKCTVWAYPRRLSASPVVLFQLDKEIIIGSGQTYPLKGTWANPDGGLPINAQGWIEPVPSTGTDCSAFTATGGGGSNITSSLTLNNWDPGTDGYSVDLYNSNASTMYVYTFSPRGTSITFDNPTQHAASDATSITEHETESETLHQKYQNTLYSGSVFAESTVEEHKDPRVVLRSIPFTANKSANHMMLFLHTRIGYLRRVEITELSIDGNYYVQGIGFEMKGPIIKVTWIVKEALSYLS